MKKIQKTLRALSVLLQYPDAPHRAHLGAIVEAIDEEAALPPARRAEIRALADELLLGEPLDVQARYVALFDSGRSTSLHLFEHVHGDSRDRGPAMVDLLKTYEAGGMLLGANELPDHLCVVLEFASTQPTGIAREFLAEMAHILNAIFSALLQRESRYATLIAAVLELAGHRAEAVRVPEELPLDASWEEPMAFDGCSSRGQAAPGQPQPIQIVRRAGGAQPGATA